MSGLQIRRLGWAGIEVNSAGTTLVIDMIASFGAMEPFISEPREPLPQPSRPVDAALVTHLHEDHTDPDAIASALAPGGVVLRPPSDDPVGLDAVATQAAEQRLAQRNLRAEVLAPWQTRTLGPFTVTALPAVDGFGDPQVSWLVETGGRRVLHAGDTVFHGFWWSIALRYEPIDVAFLPVNGPVCRFPHRQPPSPFPAAMDPRQAAAAAHILGARQAVPMHYGLHMPPYYEQVEDPVAAFEHAGSELGLNLTVLHPGEALGTV